MAEILKANGDRVRVTPANGCYFSLSEMQEIVGGYVEVVNLGGRFRMIVNDEGHLIGLPHNRQASLLYPFNPIVGDVLLCDMTEIH